MAVTINKIKGYLANGIIDARTYKKKDRITPAKRIYVPQGFLGKYIFSGKWSGQKYKKIQYLATSGVTSCICFTAHSLNKTKTQVILLHLDNGHKEGMSQYIKKVSELIRRDGAMLEATMICSSSWHDELDETLSNAIKKNHIKLNKINSSIGSLDIAIKLATGELFLYSETEVPKK